MVNPPCVWTTDKSFSVGLIDDDDPLVETVRLVICRIFALSDFLLSCYNIHMLWTYHEVFGIGRNNTGSY